MSDFFINPYFFSLPPLAGGLNDTTYNTYDNSTLIGVGGIAKNCVIQTDGKIILTGWFTSWNSVPVGRVVRLNTDGTLDTAFMANIGTGSNGELESLALQSDGKILIGGGYTTWDGVTVGKIVRLNTDGTRDTAFSTNIGTGSGSTYVQEILVQPNGQILVSGGFTTWNGVAGVIRVARLNSDGTRDTAFSTNVSTGANTGDIYAIALQSDGKILIGGQFTTWAGTTVNYIVRLNSDGTRDTAFTTSAGTAANGWVFVVRVQSDGKILVGGDFTTWAGTTVNRIVRLNSNGTRDTAFTTTLGASGLSARPLDILVQPDSKILIAGAFTLLGGVPVNRIGRLNSNGSLDTAFNSTNASSTFYSISLQSDGKIVLANQSGIWGSASVNGIIRLNANGTRDTSIFMVSTSANNQVRTAAIQSDDKIILGGDFTTWADITTSRIIRLGTDGTKDTAFTTNMGTGANNQTVSIAVQSDGKILIGGSFTTWNGITVNRIVRLNSDGTSDTAFTTNTGTGANSTVNTIAVQSDGKILVGGVFATWNGTTVNRVVRLNSDGTRDTVFTTNTGTGANSTVTTIAVQSDNKILVGGAFTTWNGVTVGNIVRLNSDGTRDTAFTTNNGTGASAGVTTIAVQSDNKILIGGGYLTWNGTTVNCIVRLNSDGTRDTVFTTNNGTASNANVLGSAIQSDGKILIVGLFTTWNGITVNRIVRLNSDGTRDTAFTTNNGTGANGAVNTIAIQSDGKIIIGGNFTGWNSTLRSYSARIGGA